MAIDFSQQRILIIDSSGNMRATIRDMLINLGFNDIRVMPMTQTVFEVFENENFDAVLLGHNESDSYTGLQLLEEVHAKDAFSPMTSWILMVSDSSQQSLLHAVEEEPDDVIIKPFSIGELRQRLLSLFLRRQALEPIQRVLARNAPNRAIQLCDTLIDKTSPFYDRVQFLKGKLLLESGQPVEAEKVFDRYYWRDKSPQSGLYLAKCWYQQGKLIETQSLLESVIKDAPLLTAAYDLLALVHEVQGHLEEAKDILQEAVRRSPMVIHRQMENGRILTRTGQLDKAQQAFKKSIDLGEHSCKAQPEAYLNLANVYRLQMEEQAPASYLKSISGIDQVLSRGKKRFPENHRLEVQSAMLMAKAYEDIDDDEEASAYRDKAQETMAQYGVELDMATSMEDVFQPKAPVAPELIVYQETKPSPSNNPETSAKVNRIGIRNYLAGKPGQAIRYFMSAFEHDNQNGSALLNLAQLFLEAARDNPERADERLKMFDRYLRLAERVEMDAVSQEKYQKMKTYRDASMDSLPEGPLAELLK